MDLPVISIVGFVAVPILIVAAVTWKLVKWWKSDPDPVRTLKKVGYLSLAIFGVLGVVYLILFFTYAKSDMSIAGIMGFFFVLIYFGLLVIGIKILNTDSDELLDALKRVAIGVGGAALAMIVGVTIIKPIYNSASEFVEEVTYNPNERPSKNAKLVPTPSSFCGVEFGEKIDSSSKYSPSKVDMGLDRSGFANMKRSGSGDHERSYWRSSYRPAVPFRGFKSGEVFATWSSKKIYGVTLIYELPRNRGTAADEEEFNAASRAIIQKYGVNPIKRDARGDHEHIFWLGDVRVILEWITEGTFDRAQLVLKACNMKIDAEAENESLAYYEELSRTARSQVQEGGSDAL